MGCSLIKIEVNVLASGSDGNCTLVSSDDVTIMIDAGLSGKIITSRMEAVGKDPHELSAILLTHEHSDHTAGAGIISRRYNIPIYANHGTLACSNIGNVDSTMVFRTSTQFSVGDLIVDPLPISHNAADPCSFKVSCDGKRFLLATDLGKVGNEVFEAMKIADLVMIEANHDLQMLIGGPYPPSLKKEIRSEKGHLSNINCARALWATYSSERKIFLAHLSRNNNTPALAKRTVSRTLGCKEEEIDCLDGLDDTRTISF